MKNIRQIFTLKFSLSSTFTAIVLITSILLGISTFFSMRNFIHQNIKQKLHDIIGVAVQKIDGDIHNTIHTPDDETKTPYLNIKKILQNIKAVNTDFVYVYTYRLNRFNKVEFVVDAETSQDEMSHVGDLYNEAPEEMLSVFNKPYNIRVDNYFYRDQWGMLLSGYAPFFDSKGGLAGAIGIDISAEKVFAYEMRYLLLLLGISALVSLIVLVMGNIFAKRISAPLSELSDDLLRIQKLDFDHVPVISSNIKEVIEIKDSVENMKMGLRSFRKYVPADVVSELISLHKEARLGASRKELTIMFTDIENFTSISEDLEPEYLAEKLGDYFSGMTKIIQENEGTVDKFIGDAIMAFWGAPKVIENHPFIACHAAIECQRFNKWINKRFAAQNFPQMNTRIGINTGDAVVGNMGYEKRLSYTTIGDSVNLASRLEGLNKYYGTNIIISESTYDIVNKDFETRILDVVAVKGKMRGIRVYELLGEKNNFETKNPDFIKLYKEGFYQYYLNKEWKKAHDIFQQLVSMDPADKPSAIIYDRTSRFMINPPDGEWSGVIMLRDK